MALVAGLGSAGGGARRVVAFAGIGNPTGFLHTVRSMGMDVVAGCWFDDHHLYQVEGKKDAGDFESLLRGTQGRNIGSVGDDAEGLG